MFLYDPIIYAMEIWEDQGIVLSARPHGDTGAVVSVLTEEHGRHAGFVHSGTSSKNRHVIERGNVVDVHWNARTTDSLGTYKLELQRNTASALWDDPVRLAALHACCALCEAGLPEREVHSGLFQGMAVLLETLTGDIWQAAYIYWEIAFLREMGFALDLTRCVAGGTDELLYISPRSGCAVSAEKGDAYKDKLLLLPEFLKEGGGRDYTNADILKGLKMTGYFLQNRVFAQHSKGIPQERLLFQDHFAKYEGSNNETDELKHGTG